MFKNPTICGLNLISCRAVYRRCRAEPISEMFKNPTICRVNRDSCRACIACIGDLKRQSKNSYPPAARNGWYWPLVADRVFIGPPQICPTCPTCPTKNEIYTAIYGVSERRPSENLPYTALHCYTKNEIHAANHGVSEYVMLIITCPVDAAPHPQG